MSTLAVLVIFQPFVDLAEAIIKFFAETIGFSWGLSIVAPDAHRARCSTLPLSLTGIRSMRRMQLVAPELKARAGEVQGRPRAPAARDARALQAARRQPARLLLPVPAADPVLHRGLLAAALATAFNEDVDRERQRARASCSSTASSRSRRAPRRWILIVLFIVTTVLTFLYTTATTQTATGAAALHLPWRCRCCSPRSSPASRPASRSTGSRPTSGASDSRWWSSGSCRCRPPPTPEEVGGGRRRLRPRRGRRRSADERRDVLPRTRSSGSRRLLDEIVDALDLDAEVVVEERDDEIAARIDGEELGLADRPPRADDRRDPAALLPGRVPRPRRAQAGLGRRRGLPRAPPRDGRAPGRPRRRAGAGDRQGDRARADDRDRAQDRPRPPRGALRARDVQRGRGARALRDRRARSSAIDASRPRAATCRTPSSASAEPSPRPARQPTRLR